MFSTSCHFRFLRQTDFQIFKCKFTKIVADILRCEAEIVASRPLLPRSAFAPSLYPSRPSLFPSFARPRPRSLARLIRVRSVPTGIRVRPGRPPPPPPPGNRIQCVGRTARGKLSDMTATTKRSATGEIAGKAAKECERGWKQIRKGLSWLTNAKT